jgi:hypothetical protein
MRKINDGIKLTGKVNLKLYDSSGKLKLQRNIKNTVQTAGKYSIMDQWLASPSLNKPGWMEVGTSTGGTTLLGAYVSGSRTALDSKTRGSNAVITMVCTLAAGVGTGALTEAGVFDVVTQNTVNMLCYTTFSVINKAAGDSLVITWTVTGS